MKAPGSLPYGIRLWLVVTALLVSVMLWSRPSHAASPAHRPRLTVFSKGTVEGSEIRLGDIATIAIHDETQRDLATALAAVSLGDAPAPKGSTTLLGTVILQRIEGAGFDVGGIGYSIPRTVIVERSGRLLQREEVIEALKSKLNGKEAEAVKIRDVHWTQDYILPTGQTELIVQPLGKPSGGKLPLRVSVRVDGHSAARFLAHAMVDYWKEVPVLSRTVDRGMLISPDDIQLVRVNLNNQPSDIVNAVEDAVGKQTKTRIAAGETIRRSHIDIPPTVERGAHVTIRFVRRGLHATASGVAVEDGQADQIISVQNAQSKRIVQARVISPELVEVDPQ
ncbi:MAG: flagellar basal body P-ring formation protein FlgA [Bdellovibrionales bacterium]|nr:flagellar basal body P-ring formation protein FlgA [Bdellovibrionales bacterium]